MEHKVRLRLGIDSFYKDSEIKSSTFDSGLSLKKPSVWKCDPAAGIREAISEQHHLPVVNSPGYITEDSTAVTASVQSEDINARASIINGGQKRGEDEEITLKERKKLLTVAIDDDEDDDDATGVKDRYRATHSPGGSKEDVVHLSELMDYVHKKYGIPKYQLKQLLKRGVYETNILDTSSGEECIGPCPTIRCPVESHVCLATPNHDDSTLPHDDVNDVRPTSRLVHGDHECDTSLPSISPRGKLVYSTGKYEDQQNVGNLNFESKFESGNLQKASYL